jgi:predicted aldo/keto reductase-like oxidoreductase
MGRLVQRQGLILQTKVNPAASGADFRMTLETSFKTLQVDYVDLYAFQGMNTEYHYEWVFGEGREGGKCMDVIKENLAAGTIRWF